MKYAAVLFAILVCGTLAIRPADSQTPVKPQPKAQPKAQPKLEAIAETRLLMEGMAETNFRGLERLLKERPTEAKAWIFARGQALLIAESANLLMLRPPKSSGQSVWFDRAVELRTGAHQLAKTITTENYELSKAGLVRLANTCNRCHQSFRVDVQINVFSEKLDVPVSHP